MKVHRFSIIGVKAEVKRISSTSSAFVGERTKSIWGTHEWELKVEFFVVATVQVDGLTAILILTEF
jgi:hypothetical protein